MKCNKCFRLFATKRALDQHMRDAPHNKRPPQNKNAKRTRGPKQGPVRSAPGFVINPSRVPTPPGSTIIVSGEDRIASVEIQSGKSVFLSWPISPGMAPRITTLSRAYQRISWQQVRITVTPQASTTINGGYVCGFSMDPTDNAITASELSATQWSSTKKWYETASVSMPPKGELLYTSTGEDPRLSIPSVFWLISEGKPSSSLTVIVTINWTIKLTQPSLEHGHFSGILLNGDIWPVANNYNLELRSGGTTTQTFTSIMPDSVKLNTGYSFFRVPTFNIEYNEGVGDTGTIQMHFLAYNSSDGKMYYSQDGKNVDKNVWQTGVTLQCLVPCSTFLKYAGTGNPCGTLVSQPHPCPSRSSAGLPSSSKTNSDRLRELECSLQKLMSYFEEGSITSMINLQTRHQLSALSQSPESSLWQDPMKP